MSWNCGHHMTEVRGGQQVQMIQCTSHYFDRCTLCMDLNTNLWLTVAISVYIYIYACINVYTSTCMVVECNLYIDPASMKDFCL